MLTEFCKCDQDYKNQPYERKLHRVIFLLISRSECTVPFLYAAEESLLNSAVVIKLLLQ